MKFFSHPILFILLAVSGNTVSALPLFSQSAVVTSTDRSATFASLTSNGTDLSTYTEGSLSITVPDLNFQGFTAFSPGDSRTTGFHYGDGGNVEYVSISGTDNATFSALDFLFGNGLSFTTPITIRWETYLDGLLTGSGTESGIGNGQIVGWTDVLGIDELRVAAGPAAAPGFGNDQSIAIDDLRAQIRAVPLPAAFWLMGSALLGLFSLMRRKAKTV